MRDVFLFVFVMLGLFGLVVSIGIDSADFAPPSAAAPNITQVQVHYSNYWPPYGGKNCGVFDETTNTCISAMTNGEPWSEHTHDGAACIKTWDFELKFRMPEGDIRICKDQGDMVAIDPNDGLPWIDVMEPNPRYDYGEIITISIIN